MRFESLIEIIRLIIEIIDFEFFENPIFGKRRICLFFFSVTGGYEKKRTPSRTDP
jgi:hypothetical protein